MKQKTFKRRISAAVLFRTAALVSLFPMLLLANEDDTGEKGEKTFFTGSSLNGGFFLMGRNRDRLNATTPDSVWNDNLDHISTMASLGFKTRDYVDIFGFEVAGFAVMDMANGEPSGVNQENEFSFAGDYWSNNWDDGEPRNGVSVYRATAHVALPFGLKLTGGMGQLGIEGVIGNNWSYMPGSYTGGKAEWNIKDKVFLSYAWVNNYKAPWFQRTAQFSTKNAWDGDVYADENIIDYLHGGSVKVKIGENYSITGSVGNSEGYMMNYFGKLAGHFEVADGFDASYQFYASDTYDEWDTTAHGYDGLAQYHALTTALNVAYWNFKLEGTHTIAKGKLGNYLPRLTRGYGNSQGGFQVWWDLRSDWNENGETAIYTNISRKLDDLFRVPGWTLGVGGAIGFGAEYLAADMNPGDTTQVNRRDGQEYAWKVDLSYTTDLGRFKGATFAIHYMQYTNAQSELGDWTFPNMFSSERDLMVKAILPFGVNIK